MRRKDHSGIKNMEIRTETAADHAAIIDLHLQSFPGPDEARLVVRLRDDGDAVLSLVAVEGDTVVGHAMFSKMTAPFPALGLAPVAVHANWRRRGIAARLIEQGLSLAKHEGWTCVFVLGDPNYYRRLRFSVAGAAGFESPYAGPNFMALPLSDDGLPATSGCIEYAPAFAELAGGNLAAD